MIRRPPRSTRVRSSAASDVYKRQLGPPPRQTTLARHALTKRSRLRWIALSGISIELPFGAITGTLERDPGARVPPAELGRTVHVVGEKEVLNRVLARVPPPTQMRGGGGVDP